jgi:hypothetical protein
MSKALISSENGMPLLKFLWRWKLVSTPALARKFFPERNPLTAYNWLLKLKHHHFLTFHRDAGNEYALWSLNRAGFELVRRRLPTLREEGFRSEAPYHDWLVSAFHLGEWLIERPSGVRVFSEQELRRVEAENYPAWVPKSSEHRPDGYWHRVSSSDPRTLALEMELNPKKAARYQSVGTFYGESPLINRVLWVVPTLGDAKRIGESLAKGPGSRSEMHSFVRLGSFLKQGWSAPIEHGAGIRLTVSSFLQKALAIPECDMGATTACHVTLKSLLESRIRPIHSASSKVSGAGDFSRPTTTSIVVGPAPLETRSIIQPEVSR